MNILSHFSNHFDDFYFEFSTFISYLLTVQIFSANVCKSESKKPPRKTRWFLRKESSKITYIWQRRCWEPKNRNEESLLLFLGIFMCVCTVYIFEYVCMRVTISLWFRIESESHAKKTRIECFYRHLASIYCLQVRRIKYITASCIDKCETKLVSENGAL